ncbi:thiosulfate sulfurtransferase GlpE [Pseudoalteromonas sp. SR44-5]|jgi:thiosulfate sulfurtransferase|uniref:Thiosulfate sulfurtransferase GlpE n=2 Tax=Pseudoalteromonas TaxID=53246 RepID=A0ABY3FGP4_9GAMM|nr:MULTISPECIES: thiosulfate sulfurtransferase GlpE [Pseudoalteromonas]MBB1293991.1 thiosulfate sulfurtransferase GlpE [Pseudoalteromonas sp. SR41-4]MBB1301988.1 thiosulfate sulfurtransferase GlpE [Pseudoalteromonas sp. SR44-8]MBB1310551.1 thiosulfate sulfurtransferase GlpE [Pseudoalteromonas sp. SR41-8]MBB1367055.1 thiosulfate sulfurtransferase GlpE [Pseudoalteromonas sp. SR44-5]MBB1398674.1 thiosulfate sulfurtransferase GlpE [Pseudoalteromonas sp. SG44-8]|tara:strand:+ start:13253 stop:13570 length:318 start_codon:yes stop_codon:yes gene_type:complete
MAFKHISITETQALLNKDDVVIADIRDPNSYQAGHIPGSEHLSNANIGEFMMNKEFDQPIIIVCYHGMSSQGAASYLAEQGFEDVYSMDGGFTQWETQLPEQVER